MPRIEGPVLGEGVQAVALALHILEHLALQQDPVGVTAIANVLGVSKSRVHRHLRTLTEQNYVVQAADSDRYRIGLRLVSLGRAVAENFDVAQLARPALRSLRDDLGFSVALTLCEPSGARVVATLAGNSAVEIGVKPGSVLGFHHSAQGKVMMAFGDEGLAARVLRGRLAAPSPQTITSIPALRQQIEEVRRQGWAVAPGESSVGVNALAAPVFDASGLLVGAVAVVDTVQFVQPVPAAGQVARVRRAASEISRALGYEPVRRTQTANQQGREAT